MIEQAKFRIVPRNYGAKIRSGGWSQASGGGIYVTGGVYKLTVPRGWKPSRRADETWAGDQTITLEEYLSMVR